MTGRVEDSGGEPRGIFHVQVDGGHTVRIRKVGDTGNFGQ